VTESFAVLVARHEGLRTAFKLGRRSFQSTLAEGTLPLECYETKPARRRGDRGWAGAAARGAIAEELRLRLNALAVPVPGELPIRMWLAMAPDGQHVMAAAISCTHLVADYTAMQVLKREFAELMADPSARVVGPARYSPFDQANLEQEPHFRRQAENALSAWSELLPRMRPSLHPEPSGVRSSGKAIAVTMNSPAAATALLAVAARNRMSRSSAVLACVCALLGARLGADELIFPTIMGNRSDRRLANYVGTLAQGTLVRAATSAASFDELVSQTWAAIVQSGLHGFYDAYARAKLVTAIERERGVTLSCDPLFNNLAAESRPRGRDAADVPPSPMRARTTFQARSLPSVPTLIRFELHRVDDYLELTLRIGDSARVPEKEAKGVLRTIERLLVAAASANLDRRALTAAMASQSR
jgi:hypothetical protein